MAKPLLDPWNDAAQIAAYLNDNTVQLIVGLGAEWCSLCDSVRPRFAVLAAAAHPAEHWLWLNLEEHSELLGDFMPQTLPLLWVYQGSKLVAHGQIDAASGLPSKAALLETLTPLSDLPESSIRTRLIQPDWAV